MAPGFDERVRAALEHQEAEATSRIASSDRLYGSRPSPALEHFLDTLNFTEATDPLSPEVDWLRGVLASNLREPLPADVVREINRRLLAHPVLVLLPRRLERPRGPKREADVGSLVHGISDATSTLYAELITFLLSSAYWCLHRCAKCPVFFLDLRGRRGRGPHSFCGGACKNAYHNAKRAPDQRREEARRKREHAARLRRQGRIRARCRELIAAGFDADDAREAAEADHPLP